MDLNKAIAKQDELAKNYNNLANLLLTVHRQPPADRPEPFAGRDLLVEAEDLQLEAVEILEEISHPEIYRAYSVLAQIAEAQGDPDAARAWRRKERAAFVAFPGNWARLQRQFGALAQAIAQALNGKQEALDFLEGEYPKMKASGADWQTMPDAIQRLLAGERDLDNLADELDLGGAQYLILGKALEALEGAGPQRSQANAFARPRRSGALTSDVHPAVRNLAPLVLGVVALAQGQDDLRPQVTQALDQLAQQDDWRALSGALQRVLAGERDRDALAPALDEIDVQLLDLALGALAGDAEAQARLEQLAQRERPPRSQANAFARPRRSGESEQLEQLQQAFQAWLQSPAGQQAVQDVQAQGLGQAAAMEQLLMRFMQSQNSV
jgi:hypothetical protein